MSEISSAEWRAYAQDSEREISTLHTRIATLESQLAEARRDSERLDAVEQNSWTVARWRKTEYCTGGEYTITPKTRMVLGGWEIFMDNDVAELPTIREAIDAAIKAKEAQ